MCLLRIAVALVATLAATPAAAQQAAPLFADTAPLRLILQGPLSAIAANRNEAAARPATLTVGTEQLPVTLSARGITRRAKDICAFPPLRVEFPNQPPPTSLFSGQRRLKLVTHCRTREEHQQHVLLEYAAYRMFNLLSPASFRARLATIDYRDSGGRPPTSRVGFFIEEIDDVARRNGMSRFIAGPRIHASSLEPRHAALGALFEYMIGNLDWSMRAGPAGESCCHNFRLLTAPGSSAPVAVPYDFDFSGLVDAPYATPPAQIPVASVRVRNYRGYCLHNAEALQAARAIRAKQGELLGVLSSVPGLVPRTAAKASAYLVPFFQQIADDATVRDKILSRCVR